MPRDPLTDIPDFTEPPGKSKLDGEPASVEPDSLKRIPHSGSGKPVPAGRPAPRNTDNPKRVPSVVSGKPAVADRAGFRGEKDVLAAVREHLRNTPEADRPFQRYFSLANVSSTLGPEDLRLARAALAKLLNSLSWEAEIVAPQAADAEGTVYAIDLRTLGWDEKTWRELLKLYPYGLRLVDDREAQQEVAQLAGVELPSVRADWFIATASRPPLYREFLRLPDNLPALERTLKVDSRADFLDGKLARAGFSTSGVALHNRLVERHEAAYGAYWRTYDFAGHPRSNVYQFPLGPPLKDNPFSDWAFRDDGGEVLFSLPNGLQGYFLVNDKDQRIDAAPAEVVSDNLRTAGTPVVVTGLSCIACHRHGVLPFQDMVRDESAATGEGLEKVHQLFPPGDAMAQLVDRDVTRFRQALVKATGPFLQVGGDREKDIFDFREPVGEVARQYHHDLGLEQVAAELGIADPKHLQAAIQGNDRLRKLGLGPLVNGGTIRRSDWDSMNGSLTTFAAAALELGLGTPCRLQR